MSQVYLDLTNKQTNKQTLLQFIQVRTGYNYLYNNLKTLGKNEELNINQGFISKLKHRIYS